MELNIFEELKKFKIADIAVWLKEILLFIFKPSKFGTIFFSKNIVQQVEQILFYTILNLLIYFIVGSEKSAQMLGRSLMIIMLTAIPYMVMNFISFLIIKRSISFWNICSYIIITQLIFFIPINISLHLFFENENFIFIFIMNIFFCLAFYYNFFIIWFSLTTPLITKIIGCISNIILLNIFLLILGLTAFDSYSTVNSTSYSVADEFNNNAKVINFRGKIEVFKVITDIGSNDSIYVLSYKHNDTLRDFRFDNISEVLKDDKRNIKTIDSIMSKLNYKRNKEIFNFLRNHYRDKSIYFNNQKKLIEVTRYRDSKSKLIVAYENKYKVDKELSLNINKFFEARDELEHSNEISRYPLDAINYLATPLNYIEDRYFIDTGKTLNVIIK